MQHSHLAAALLRVGVALIAALLGLAGYAQRASDPAASQAPHFWSDPGLRTIVVAAPAERLAPKSGNLLANLVVGELPGGATQATVVTDSNCAPDANGISHCLNDLKIGAAHITVQHHHDMSKVPCLTPGEKVNLLDSRAFRQL
jgi:hypothetical protein